MFKKRESFGLIEILVGAILLLTVASGLLVSVVGVRQYVNRSERRLIAVNLARKYFSAWNNYVSADIWGDCGNNPLACNDGVERAITLPDPPPDLSPGEPINYSTSTYSVTDGPSGDFREVVINIRWQ
ncbi:MAG: type II secretion system protein [Candidatus Omnitrophota bacterium]